MGAAHRLPVKTAVEIPHLIDPIRRLFDNRLVK